MYYDARSQNTFGCIMLNHPGMPVCWMTLRKGDEIGILMRRHKIALSGEYTLGDATDLSQGGLSN
jgi:hypothetical protein